MRVSHLRARRCARDLEAGPAGADGEGTGRFRGRPTGARVQFRSLTDGIDTTTPAGRFFFHVMASLAQMERELLAERTRAGLMRRGGGAGSAAASGG